jgi:hypothetical protein
MHHAVDPGEDCMDALHRIGQCSFVAGVGGEITRTPAKRRDRAQLRFDPRFDLRIERAAADLDHVGVVSRHHVPRPHLAQPAGADHAVHDVVPVGRVGREQAADIGDVLPEPDRPERTTLLSCLHRRPPAKLTLRRLHCRNLTA